MHKALVTGGAGFLGSHLCNLLLDKNYEVICVDNLITESLDNIKNINPRIIFIQHDITEPLYIPQDIPQDIHQDIHQDIDLIFHLASPASPVDYLKFPLETLKTNSIGTYNVLELARVKKAKFLLTSTSEIYGDPLVNPQPESYWGNVNPIGPRSVYDEGKRFAEALTMAFYRKYNLDTKIVRIFNTYGPKMRANDGRVVSNFITQALKNENITIYGSGNQTRSFCYIDDQIDGIYKLMMSDYHEPVNIGNPEEHTINNLAHIILDLIPDSKSKIVFKNLPIDDPKQRKPDINTAKEILNWEPKIPLKQGILNTINYFKQTLQQQIQHQIQ